MSVLSINVNVTMNKEVRFLTSVIRSDPFVISFVEEGIEDVADVDARRPVHIPKLVNLLTSPEILGLLLTMIESCTRRMGRLRSRVLQSE